MPARPAAPAAQLPPPGRSLRSDAEGEQGEQGGRGGGGASAALRGRRRDGPGAARSFGRGGVKAWAAEREGGPPALCPLGVPSRRC